MANRLTIVPVWPDDKGAEIVGVEMRPNARRALVFATCRNRGLAKILHLALLSADNAMGIGACATAPWPNQNSDLPTFPKPAQPCVSLTNAISSGAKAVVKNALLTA